LKWLCAESFTAKHNDIVHRLAADSGEWFLKHEIFEKWNTDPDKHLLLCPGKRIISLVFADDNSWSGQNFRPVNFFSIVTDVRSRVISFLEERFKEVAIVYFYLDHEAQQQQTSIKIMATLLKQLVYSLPILPSVLKVFYDPHSSARSAPEQQDLPRLTELFFEICAKDFQKCILPLMRWTNVRMKRSPHFYQSCKGVLRCPLPR